MAASPLDYVNSDVMLYPYPHNATVSILNHALEWSFITIDLSELDLTGAKSVAITYDGESVNVDIS